MSSRRPPTLDCRITAGPSGGTGRKSNRIIKVERRALHGAAWRFDDALNNSEESSTLNTSFIERLNLTIRQSSAYLSRRTLSHARSTERLDEHLELLRCYYNFVRSHGALKFGREIRTPAMQAGLTTRRLTFRDIFSEQVQVPPVAIVAIFVLADLSSANPAQRLPPPWYYIHHHSGFVRLEVETSDPQALQSDELVD